MRKINTVKEYIDRFFIDNKTFLEKNYPGISSAILLRRYLLWSQLEVDHIFLRPNDTFFKMTLEGVPFEHLLGSKFFYNHNFLVTSDVLIPRSETEILVEDAVYYIKKNYHQNFKIAEVGIGSGCIFLSVLAEIDAPLNCTAIDIDQKAIDVSQKNLFRLQNTIHPDSQITFCKQDRLFEIQGTYDLILSNPPYIKRQGGLDGVHQQVLKFEPHVALFLEDEDYQKWFGTFFAQSSALLRDNGMLMMEGHEDSLEELKQIAEKFFSKCELKLDYTRALRFLYLQK